MPVMIASTFHSFKFTFIFFILTSHLSPYTTVSTARILPVGAGDLHLRDLRAEDVWLAARQESVPVDGPPVIPTEPVPEVVSGSASPRTQTLPSTEPPARTDSPTAPPNGPTPSSSPIDGSSSNVSQGQDEPRIVTLQLASDFLHGAELVSIDGDGADNGVTLTAETSVNIGPFPPLITVLEPTASKGEPSESANAGDGDSGANSFFSNRTAVGATFGTIGAFAIIVSVGLLFFCYRNRGPSTPLPSPVLATSSSNRRNGSTARPMRRKSNRDQFRQSHVERTILALGPTRVSRASSDTESTDSREGERFFKVHPATPTRERHYGAGEKRWSQNVEIARTRPNSAVSDQANVVNQNQRTIQETLSPTLQPGERPMSLLRLHMPSAVTMGQVDPNPFATPLTASATSPPAHSATQPHYLKTSDRLAAAAREREVKELREFQREMLNRRISNGKSYLLAGRTSTSPMAAATSAGIGPWQVRARSGTTASTNSDSTNTSSNPSQYVTRSNVVRDNVFTMNSVGGGVEAGRSLARTDTPTSLPYRTGLEQQRPHRHSLGDLPITQRNALQQRGSITSSNYGSYFDGSAGNGSSSGRTRRYSVASSSDASTLVVADSNSNSGARQLLGSQVHSRVGAIGGLRWVEPLESFSQGGTGNNSSGGNPTSRLS